MNIRTGPKATIPLVDAPRLIREATGDRVGYHACWRVVTAGDVPSFRKGRRLFISTADLPAIVRALDL